MPSTPLLPKLSLHKKSTRSSFSHSSSPPCSSHPADQRQGVATHWTGGLRVAVSVLVAVGVLSSLSACSPRDEGGGGGSGAAARPEMMRHEGVQNLKQRSSSDASNRARKASAEMAIAGISPRAASAPAPRSAAQSEAVAAAAEDSDAAATARFLAVRHEMVIESPAPDLAGLWNAVKARCAMLDCQVEASALERETSHSEASAYLTMRVNPRDFAALTEALGADAKVLNHETSSEDKTNAVIDVEAQIKNRSEYRDSLRELLRERGVKRTLSDLIEIRDTLSQVQAEIDAAQAQRKSLERETAKQFVRMRFQTPQIVLSGTYSPWLQTWEQAWGALTGSAQGMVIAAAALLPWVLALGVTLLIVAPLLRRKWRAGRAPKVQAAVS